MTMYARELTPKPMAAAVMYTPGRRAMSPKAPCAAIVLRRATHREHLVAGWSQAGNTSRLHAASIMGV